MHPRDHLRRLETGAQFWGLDGCFETNLPPRLSTNRAESRWLSFIAYPELTLNLMGYRLYCNKQFASQLFTHSLHQINHNLVAYQTELAHALIIDGISCSANSNDAGDQIVGDVCLLKIDLRRLNHYLRFPL